MERASGAKHADNRTAMVGAKKSGIESHKLLMNSYPSSNFNMQ